MTLRERIGIDLSRNMRIEDGVEWAARNNVKYLDIQLDNETNAFGSLEDGLAGRDYLVAKAKVAGLKVD